MILFGLKRGQIAQRGILMTLVKNWTNYIIQDVSFNSSFIVSNHRNLIKINLCPKFKSEGREEFSKQVRCLNFVRPKLPREGGQSKKFGPMYQILLVFFWKASLSQNFRLTTLSFSFGDFFPSL